MSHYVQLEELSIVDAPAESPRCWPGLILDIGKGLDSRTRCDGALGSVSVAGDGGLVMSDCLAFLAYPFAVR